MKKTTKTVICSLLLVLSLIVPVFLSETVETEAASGKTIRVATEKKLKTALKNKKVDTIVFRSSTYKAITISSTKAKAKQIVIDAPNAEITNTAKFKKVELINAKKYTEAVSGNTIEAYNGDVLVVAAGIKVKKLILSEPKYANYTILKNASIKSVVMADDGHKSTFDKKTRTLVFDTIGIWYSFDPDYYGTEEGLVTEEFPLHYTAVLDKSGRILESTYKGWADDYRDEYKYDKNGNCIEHKRYNLGYVEAPELVTYYEYVYEGNRVVEVLDHHFDPDTVICKYAYDKNGRLTGSSESGSYYSEDNSYTYDKNGLLVLSITTKMWFENESLSSRKSWKNTYTYDKNGCLIKQEDDYTDEHFSRLYTYEYDKAGNMIHSVETTITYMGDGTMESEPFERWFEYDSLGLKLKYKYDFSYAEQGDIVTFGSYEQDNDSETGQEQIDWVVLSKSKNGVLLLSKYILDVKPFHSVDEGTVWEQSTLRTWLNKDFYNTAFDDTEKKMLKKKSIPNKENDSNSLGGKNTKDKVFLLSVDDTNNTKYGFNDENEYYDITARCAATPYALSKGLAALSSSDHINCGTADGEPSSLWWLRDPGLTGIRGTGIDAQGEYLTNIPYISTDVGVRPVIFVALKG
jgi:hypothetical protein